MSSEKVNGTWPPKTLFLYREPLRGKSFLSKMGSPSLRKALCFPAITAKNHNPLLKAFAQKLAKKGKHTMVIIGAIMRKLLHIVFGIIKHKTPFNPDLLQNAS